VPGAAFGAAAPSRPPRARRNRVLAAAIAAMDKDMNIKPPQGSDDNDYSSSDNECDEFAAMLRPPSPPAPLPPGFGAAGAVGVPAKATRVGGRRRRGSNSAGGTQAWIKNYALHSFTGSVQDHGRSTREGTMALVNETLGAWQQDDDAEYQRQIMYASVSFNRRVQLQFAQTSLVFEAILTANDPTPLSDEYPRTPCAWAELQALTNTSSPKSAASVAGQWIAIGITWRACMLVRPTIFGELAAGLFTLSDLGRIARKGIGLYLTVDKNGKMTPRKRRIIIKPGADFSRYVDLAIAASAERCEKAAKNKAETLTEMRRAHRCGDSMHVYAANVGMPNKVINEVAIALDPSMPAGLPDGIVAYLGGSVPKLVLRQDQRIAEGRSVRPVSAVAAVELPGRELGPGALARPSTPPPPTRASSAGAVLLTRAFVAAVSAAGRKGKARLVSAMGPTAEALPAPACSAGGVNEVEAEAEAEVEPVAAAVAAGGGAARAASLGGPRGASEAVAPLRRRLGRCTRAHKGDECHTPTEADLVRAGSVATAATDATAVGATATRRRGVAAAGAATTTATTPPPPSRKRVLSASAIARVAGPMAARRMRLSSAFCGWPGHEEPHPAAAPTDADADDGGIARAPLFVPFYGGLESEKSYYVHDMPAGEIGFAEQLVRGAVGGGHGGRRLGRAAISRPLPPLFGAHVVAVRSPARASGADGGGGAAAAGAAGAAAFDPAADASTTTTTTATAAVTAAAAAASTVRMAVARGDDPAFFSLLGKAHVNAAQLMAEIASTRSPNARNREVVAEHPLVMSLGLGDALTTCVVLEHPCPEPKRAEAQAARLRCAMRDRAKTTAAFSIWLDKRRCCFGSEGGGNGSGSGGERGNGDHSGNANCGGGDENANNTTNSKNKNNKTGFVLKLADGRRYHLNHGTTLVSWEEGEDEAHTVEFVGGGDGEAGESGSDEDDDADGRSPLFVELRFYLSAAVLAACRADPAAFLEMAVEGWREQVMELEDDY
jgi:hypothetical protein